MYYVILKSLVRVPNLVIQYSFIVYKAQSQIGYLLEWGVFSVLTQINAIQYSRLLRFSQQCNPEPTCLFELNLGGFSGDVNGHCSKFELAQLSLQRELISLVVAQGKLSRERKISIYRYIQVGMMEKSLKRRVSI